MPGIISPRTTTTMFRSPMQPGKRAFRRFTSSGCSPALLERLRTSSLRSDGSRRRRNFSSMEAATLLTFASKWDTRAWDHSVPAFGVSPACRHRRFGESPERCLEASGSGPCFASLPAISTILLGFHRLSRDSGFALHSKRAILACRKIARIEKHVLPPFDMLIAPTEGGLQ